MTQWKKKRNILLFFLKRQKKKHKEKASMVHKTNPYLVMESIFAVMSSVEIIVGNWTKAVMTLKNLVTLTDYYFRFHMLASIDD